MAEEEVWQIDPVGISLDDYITLEKGFGKGQDPQQLKETLGRLVVNKTEKEIGSMSIRDLDVALGKALAAFRELAVPKATDTP